MRTILLYLLPAVAAVPLAAAPPPRARVQVIGAAHVLEAELLSLDPSGAELRDPAGAATRIERDDLQWIDVDPIAGDDPAAPSTEAPPLEVWLSNGDVIACSSLGIADETLEVIRGAGEHATRWSIPLEFVRAVLIVRGDVESRRLLQRTILLASFASDTLLLANGDRIEGQILAWGAEGCRLETPLGERVIPQGELSALVLDPSLIVVPDRSGNWSRVELEDASHLAAASVACKSGEFHIAVESEFSCTIPASKVARIDFFGPRAAPLTQAPPADVEFLPFLSRSSRYLIDRNVNGGPLQVGTDGAAWGVGAASGSRLRWELPQGFRKFEVTVGIDTDARAAGSVEFILRADGVELSRSGIRRAGDEPLRLGPVDIRTTRQLELAAEYGDRGDILDLGDWLRPTLLR